MLDGKKELEVKVQEALRRQLADQLGGDAVPQQAASPQAGGSAPEAKLLAYSKSDFEAIENGTQLLLHCFKTKEGGMLTLIRRMRFWDALPQNCKVKITSWKYRINTRMFNGKVWEVHAAEKVAADIIEKAYDLLETYVCGDNEDDEKRQLGKQFASADAYLDSIRDKKPPEYTSLHRDVVRLLYNGQLEP